ncbi:unnamed protein product [Nesidiocoris tenuis]|uniref:protein-histidine N-methyltransferase n=1 Tax=Nesidiocoris tenuis TaxID=355587 RepID=A0A6H5GNI6_9HEMI|nr:unnamed protein product [Nesidiocoris tenuis]
MTVVDSLKIVDHLKIVGTGKMSIVQAESGHSDLLPGVYEGGMKIWESTFDLGELLFRKLGESLKGKTILDLGCGSGILGIIALKQGCASVHFQDYNRDVIVYFTIPNVQLNGDELLPKSQFWSGDWKSYENVDDSQFDVIITSETIYNPQSYQKLHDVIRKKLKPGGSAYLAGKSYYFGVGGSIKGFMDFVVRENVLQAVSLWSNDEGKGKLNDVICFIK